MMNDQSHTLENRVPVSSDPGLELISSRLQRQLVQLAGKRPWRRSMQVTVTANEDLKKNGKSRLTVWVVAENAVDALWAGSALGDFHLAARTVCPRISRIVFTSETMGITGHAPSVTWKSRRRHPRERQSWRTEYREFETALNSCAHPQTVVPGGFASSIELLGQIGRSPAIQWEAIVQFVRHASNHGFLDCSVEEALRILDIARTILPCNSEGTILLTRWRAMQMLAEKHRLRGHVGAQRPLRPIGTAATPNEIMELICSVFGRSREELAGSRRTASLTHPRYFAAAVIRRATSRSLLEIGSVLGGRDHATVLSGLYRIDHWNELDPVHGKLLNSFAQVADNLGLMKRKDYRVMAAKELEGIRELTRRTARLASGIPDLRRSERHLAAVRQPVSTNGNVISLGDVRDRRSRANGTA